MRIEAIAFEPFCFCVHIFYSKKEMCVLAFFVVIIHVKPRTLSNRLRHRKSYIFVHKLKIHSHFKPKCLQNQEQVNWNKIQAERQNDVVHKSSLKKNYSTEFFKILWRRFVKKWIYFRVAKKFCVQPKNVASEATKKRNPSCNIWKPRRKRKPCENLNKLKLLLIICDISYGL